MKTVRHHLIAQLSRGLQGRFGRIWEGFERPLIRNKDLLFPGVRNRPSVSIRSQNPFRAPLKGLLLGKPGRPACRPAGRTAGWKDGRAPSATEVCHCLRIPSAKRCARCGSAPRIGSDRRLCSEHPETASLYFLLRRFSAPKTFPNTPKMSLKVPAKLCSEMVSSGLHDAEL